MRQWRDESIWFDGDRRSVPAAVREAMFAHQHLHAALEMLEALASGDDPEPARQRMGKVESEASAAGAGLPLQSLSGRLGLDNLDVVLLLAALRPQVRPESRGRIQTVGRILETLFPDALDQWSALAALRADRPLRKFHLVDLGGIDGPPVECLLDAELLAPPWLAAYLLEQRELGRVLGQVARFSESGGSQAEDASTWQASGVDRELVALTAAWHEHVGGPMAFSLVGDPGSGKTVTARRLIAAFGRVRLEVDATLIAAMPPRQAAWCVRELYAAAVATESWVIIDGAEHLVASNPATSALRSCLQELPVLTVLLSPRPLTEEAGLPPRTIRQLWLDRASEGHRASIWGAHVSLLIGHEGASALAARLAAQFELSPAQVRNAAVDARLVTLAGGALGVPDDLVHEESAVRQLRGNPVGIAKPRRTNLRLDDLVLPSDELELVREIVDASRHRTALMHRWGARERLGYGTGVVCLFSGEPGTGKTLASQIIAAELGLDLFQVSLPQVLSKWVGDTEKQIARIFKEARACRAVLLFDEADSLLGARTEVRNASDRFANMSTNYLLQEIEAFEGLVVLTTNLEENLDTAAARRILFRLRFPFPDAASRAILWQSLMPRRANVASDVDYSELGEDFELSGGHIKNAVIRAAYRALACGDAINRALLRDAARKECRAIGKLVRDHD